MPELPDLERARRLLAEFLIGRPAARLEVLDPSALRNAGPAELAAVVETAAFVTVDRHGKWLIARTAGSAIVIHLGMTGSLVVGPTAAPLDRFDRVRLVRATDLRYRDMRKLGGIWLAGGPVTVDSITGVLGPDARTISLDELEGCLRGRRRALKTLLMDQRLIAGLGNMLSDEVLWRARIRPAQRASTLDPEDVVELHRALRDVVRRSVRAGRIPRTRGWLSSQRAASEPRCPRCGTSLVRDRIGGRTSLWCPTCQQV